MTRYMSQKEMDDKLWREEVERVEELRERERRKDIAEEQGLSPKSDYKFDKKLNRWVIVI